MQTLILDLQNGGVAVLATDTIYGVVGQALNKETVERIYTLKGRTPTKPFIILISSIEDLKLFQIDTTAFTGAFEKYWPGPYTLILPCADSQFEYLHRGKKSLAFRLPRTEVLTTLIQQTGPLVAPSANPEGQPPATTITEAKEYFGDSVDRYIDDGEVTGSASIIIELRKDGSEFQIR